MCTYVYVCFVIGFIPFFAPLIPLWNHSATFPKKVWQCRNAPMPRSGKNIAKPKVQILVQITSRLTWGQES